MNYWYIGIINTLLFCVVIAQFYLLGRVVYGKRTKNNADALLSGQTNREYSFVRVLIHFASLLINSAIIMVVVGIFFAAAFTAIEFIHEYVLMGEGGSLEGEEFVKFKGGNFLLLLLILMITVALIQLRFRTWLGQKWRAFSLEDDDYDILEYFIQWMTIYLAVYQFMFEGMQSVMQIFDDADSTRAFFSIVLSPRNINLVVQPLLISSWMTVAVEKLRRRHMREQEEKSLQA